MACKVLIVEDHRLLAQALEARLGDEPDLEVAATVAEGDDVAAAVLRHRPDVVIMDVHLGSADGLALTSALRTRPAAPAVVVLTAYGDPETAVGAVRAGAIGFVTKDLPTEDLVQAVRAAARGESWVAPSLLGPVLKSLQSPTDGRADGQAVLSRLSARELEVLHLLVDGLDRDEIAARLRRSPNTVRTHVRTILSKLEAHSLIEAVSVGLRGGMRPAASTRTLPKDASPGGGRSSRDRGGGGST